MSSPDNFVSIPFGSSNLDVYIVRSSILRALTDALPFFGVDLLDIGCGKMPYKDYILQNSKVENYNGLDIENALIYDKDVSPDFVWDGISMPFADGSFDSAFGTEVLEHCPDPQVVLRETYRVLKKGGAFFFTVPFLWNLHEVPYDYYRYTPFALERMLQQTGFQKISIQALGGWNASLAQMLGLWAKRSPMSLRRRKIILKVLTPIVRRLIDKDSPPQDFDGNQMITGLSGVCIK